MVGPVIDFDTIAKAFPIIIAATPYVTQVVKMAFDPLLKKRSDYDSDIRILTCIMASFVGLVWLIISHYQLNSLSDILVTLLVLVVYGGVGGPLAMVAYSLVNGYLHQTPPVAKLAPESLVVGSTPVKVTGQSGDTPRQPY